MKTDDLIKLIANDGHGRCVALSQRVIAALVGGGLVALVLFAILLGVRPDLVDALQTWRFIVKVAVAVVCFVCAFRATVEVARPTADLSRAGFLLAIPIALLLSAMCVELLTTAPGSWAERAIGTNSIPCMASIAIFSIAPLVALIVALRAGAPPSPAFAGGAAGLLAGGLAATLYAFHCFDDSPLFVALWYVPVVCLVVLVGMVAGQRFLRW